jgi:Lrp/AsnC family transcriptional regulator for asnA, asnC and gidA
MGFEAMAWLGITLSENAQPEIVTEKLAAVPGVCYVVVASGRFDIMVELVCRTRSHLLDTLERHIGAITEIAHVESFYYLRLLYRSTAGGWGAARSLAAPKQSSRSLQQPESPVNRTSSNGRRI